MSPTTASPTYRCSSCARTFALLVDGDLCIGCDSLLFPDVVLVALAPRLGDIGEPRRHIEFEPLPETVPVEEPAAPAPAPAPAEPVREPEPVPA